MSIQYWLPLHARLLCLSALALGMALSALLVLKTDQRSTNGK